MYKKQRNNYPLYLNTQRYGSRSTLILTLCVEAFEDHHGAFSLYPCSNGNIKAVKHTPYSTRISQSQRKHRRSNYECFPVLKYSRLTGFDALLVDREVLNQFLISLISLYQKMHMSLSSKACCFCVEII